MGVVLLFGLLVQGLYRERDQVATLFPQTKPALRAFCEVSGCRVSPLQHIDAFVLESATLNQVGQETYELQFLVKNKMNYPLALPAVELSLTDLTDQPVMRRVLTPTELGAAVGTVAAAGEWSVAAFLHIKAEMTGPRALGYRLQVFYP
ncbi:MAG: hypothetical protein A2461_03780 [Burkholderiales bacterium RIFOXYC2_FULL_59_8]|nr:MAG: hypothetical protein A2461_03780 [Burkholderiales bacterium RIFOXYC2_FULL_59_8]